MKSQNTILKTVASNTLAQLVAKFFGAGLTLITTYYAIHLAGLSLYGDLTKILVIVAVGFTAIDFGLNAEGIRSSKSESQMRQNTQNIILARLFLSLVMVVVLNALVLVLPGGYSREVKNVFWLGSLAIIFQGIYASGNAWFQYKLTYWRSTISVVLGSLVGSGLTIYFLVYSPTLFSLVLANTLGYLTMAACSLLLFTPQLRSLRDSGRAIGALWPLFSLLQNSLTLGLILIASVIASKIDTVVLGIFRLSSEVGEYGFAYRIFDVILVFPVFIMNAIYPLSIREKLDGGSATIIDKSTKYLALLGIFTAISLWFAAPLVNLIKPGLVITTSVLRLLSLALPLFYITAPLMWSLITKKRDKLVLVVYVLAALFNLLFNLVLVPSYGAQAAAINTGLTELLIFLSLLYFSRKQ